MFLTQWRFSIWLPYRVFIQQTVSSLVIALVIIFSSNMSFVSATSLLVSWAVKDWDEPAVARTSLKQIKVVWTILVLRREKFLVFKLRNYWCLFLYLLWALIFSFFLGRWKNFICGWVSYHFQPAIEIG